MNVKFSTKYVLIRCFSIIATLLISLVTIRSYTINSNAKDWDRVVVSVTEFKESGRSYDLNYLYTYKGVEYSSDVCSFWGYTSTSEMDKLNALLEESDTINAYVNPEKPSQSALFR